MLEPAWYLAPAVAAVVLLYYGRLDPAIGTLGLRLLRMAPTRGTLSLAEVRGVAVLGVAGAAQLVFAAALVVATSVQVDLAPASMLAAVLAGPLLGLGELGLSSFLARVAVAGASRLDPGRSPTDLDHWIAMSKGGWMRTYLRTLDAAPLPFAFALTVVYVVAEEAVFRAVLVGAALPLGAVAVTVISTAAFMAVQAFQMPSWRNAIFALTGALVMGITHSVLYIETGDLAPLMVAHLTFFWLAVG